MGPLSKFDKQQAIGMLKANGGAQDKDILYSQKAQILSIAKLPKTLGTIGMVGGILCSLSVIGAILGIPMAIFGWWLRRRGVQNITVVEDAYAELAAAM